MRWFIVALTLALSACQMPSSDISSYPRSALETDIGPDADAAFISAENHARCAGFHHAFAQLTAGTASRAEFYKVAATDAETAAVEIASSTISKELAEDMVQQLAKTHAAKWAYAIEVDAESNSVQSQANRCLELASEQEEIIRNVVKAKFGFRRR